MHCMSLCIAKDKVSCDDTNGEISRLCQVMLQRRIAIDTQLKIPKLFFRR